MSIIIQTRPSYQEYLNSYYEESNEEQYNKAVKVTDPDITDDMLASYLISQRQGEYFEYTDETKQAGRFPIWLVTFSP